MNAPLRQSEALFADSTAGAVFDQARVYRYRLWREWNARRPTLCFVMLNPSTADETVNDNTVRGCMKRAREWGYGRLEVLNLFALCSTNPKRLYVAADPVGPDNDISIQETVAVATKGGGIVICAWGAHGNLRGRGEAVRQMLMFRRVVPMVLAVNADGSPRHPLYIAHDVVPSVW